MNRRQFLIAGSSVALSPLLNVAHAEWQTETGYAAGTHFQKLKNPVSTSPHKKSVVEVFYYGCPHCYHLEPTLHQWLKSKPKDVHFERMPAVLDNPNWVFMARVFYTAKELGILDQFHSAYFEAIQKDQRPIFDVPSLAKFCEPMGIKPDVYENTFKSFRVDQWVQKAKQRTQQYEITGVPSVIVNGRYLTDVSMAQGERALWKLVDHLVVKPN